MNENTLGTQSDKRITHTAFLPSLFGKTKARIKKNKCNARVEELARRYANDLDLWTGLPRHPEEKKNDNGTTDID